MVAKAYVCMYSTCVVACHVKNVNSTRGRSPLPLVKPNLGGDMPGSPDPASMRKKRSLLLQYSLTVVNFSNFSHRLGRRRKCGWEGGRINGRAGVEAAGGRGSETRKRQREKGRRSTNGRSVIDPPSCAPRSGPAADHGAAPRDSPARPTSMDPWISLNTCSAWPPHMDRDRRAMPL